MDRTARLFLCARCRDQVLLCSHCDRGQQYCSRACSRVSRLERRQETAQRYQSSRCGQLRHAARTARWRERRRSLRHPINKVTHQGCSVAHADAPLPTCDIPSIGEFTIGVDSTTNTGWSTPARSHSQHWYAGAALTGCCLMCDWAGCARAAFAGAALMTIPIELAARIERLYTVERWRVGTIARQLHVHRDTVRRVLREREVVPSDVPLRASLVDPYRSFIRETLEKYPTLTASRLHDMVCERGYAGQASHFRYLVSTMRPRPPAEAYLRLRTLPGEEMQCDWAHFGHLAIGRARRPLMGFVMVLSYSRCVFLHFCLNAQMDSFLRGHVEAFAAYAGLTRIVLYDNLKSVVLERVGDAIRFNPEFLAFAKHCRFEPRPVAIARGNQKGRVERHIDFVRKSFFAGREFTDVADLNAQARQWCEGKAFDRPWPQDDALSVRQAFDVEQPRLLELPAAGYALGQRLEVTVAKTPYVRFDWNDYTVPHTHVRRILSVLADEQRVRIFDGITELANHPRSFDRHQTIEEPAHLQALVEYKRKARARRGCDALAQVVPASTELLQMAAQRGHNLGSITAALLRLLDQYGARALQAGILDAISRDVPHPNAVRLALERARERTGRPPPLALTLPEHVARRDAPMRTHSLASYDRRYDPPKDTDDD